MLAVSLVERPPLDAYRILRELTARGVDFVVIGGIAAVLHGSARLTYDLDICFATDHPNLDALGDVLIGLNARLRDAEDAPFIPDGRSLRGIETQTMRTDAGDFDILAKPAGARSYESLRQRAERMDLGGFSVLVASLGDLIEMKSAAGRPKDVADVAELEAILRLRAGRATPPPPRPRPRPHRAGRPR